MVVWITTKKTMNDLFDQNSECESMPDIIQAGGSVTEVCFENGPIAPPLSNRPYDIRIESLDYGYLVRVGCQTLAIENKKKLISKLSEYLENPSEFQEKWNANRPLLMS